jgi:hypothetical protein
VAEEPEENAYKDYNSENVNSVPGRHLPSLYVNRSFVLRGAEVVRVAFGNSIVGEDDYPYTMAVSLPHHAAKQLAQTILDLLQMLEEDKKKEELNAGG